MFGLDQCCCVREEAKGSLCKQHKSNTDSCGIIVASSSIETGLQLPGFSPVRNILTPS